jgi:hypothetical protein
MKYPDEWIQFPFYITVAFRFSYVMCSCLNISVNIAVAIFMNVERKGSPYIYKSGSGRCERHDWANRGMWCYPIWRPGMWRKIE